MAGRRFLGLILLAGIASCHKPDSVKIVSPQELFFNRISGFCGKAFTGKLVAYNESDKKAFAGPLVMHVITCSENEIRIPFLVGENRSRTWVVRKTESGLRLKHDHRHEDGSEDRLTQYGGDTVSDGSTTRQEFPADVFSKTMFERENMTVSTQNIWALEVTPAMIFAYELRRPDRQFRIEFDLNKPVAVPPPAWGSEKI